MSFKDLTPTPVTLASGVTINYVRQGCGPTLIMIHGAMGDWRSWTPQWHVLSEKYDCISYSRRYSFPNGNPMETNDHSALVDAEDLEALMDELGIEQAILVGSSYGGFTALAMALRAPERVLAVVSVEAPMMRYADATNTGAEIARQFKESADIPAREAFARGDNEEGTRILTGGIVGKKPSDVPAHVMERRLQNVDAARSLALSNDEFPLLAPEDLGALKMPILLMSGANTAPIHKVIFNAVTAAMPNARVRIIQDSGHSVSQQQPERFNVEVLYFLADNGLLKSCRNH